MSALPMNDKPSIWDILSGSFNDGAAVQQNPAQVPPAQAPAGFEYKDPIAEMNFLEKLGMSMGGIENMNNYRNQAYNRQLGQYQQQQEAAQRNALQDIAQRMQTGELDREGALVEYAKRTGDYSKMFQSQSTPAALQEYNALLKMSPEERNLYYSVKRGNQALNLGGQQVVVDPQGNVVQVYGKTLAPGEQPQVRYEQARATETGKQQVQLDANINKKISDAKDVVDLAGQAEEYLPDASGSYVDTAFSFGKKVIGRSDRETQANAALKVISGKLVSNMPRMEGPQSDKDVQLYKDMAANIADPTVPADDKKVALQALRDLNAKYSQKQAPSTMQSAPQGGASGGGVIDFGSLK